MLQNKQNPSKWKDKISMDLKVWLICQNKTMHQSIYHISPNLTSSFREEESLRISSYPCSASSPHSPEPCLCTYQNFENKF